MTLDANQLYEEYKISAQSYFPESKRPMLGPLNFDTSESPWEFTLTLSYGAAGKIAFAKDKRCGNWVAEMHRCHVCDGGADRCCK